MFNLLQCVFLAEQSRDVTSSEAEGRISHISQQTKVSYYLLVRPSKDLPRQCYLTVHTKRLLARDALIASSRAKLYKHTTSCGVCRCYTEKIWKHPPGAEAKSAYYNALHLVQCSVGVQGLPQILAHRAFVVACQKIMSQVVRPVCSTTWW